MTRSCSIPLEKHPRSRVVSSHIEAFLVSGFSLDFTRFGSTDFPLIAATTPTFTSGPYPHRLRRTQSSSSRSSSSPSCSPPPFRAYILVARLFLTQHTPLARSALRIFLGPHYRRNGPRHTHGCCWQVLLQLGQLTPTTPTTPDMHQLQLKVGDTETKKKQGERKGKGKL